MKLVTFLREAGAPPSFGALLGEGDRVLDFSSPGAGIEPPESFLEWCDMEEAPYEELAALHGRVSEDPVAGAALEAQGAILPAGDVLLLAPVPRPGKVICIGLNYKDHATESGMELPASPVVFSKFPTSVIGPGWPVVIPDGSEQTDYEAELAVVIGRRAFQVEPADALAHVLGYCNFNDVSARDFQFADGQWQRGKSCDSFAPMGRYIATTNEVPDPHALRIRFRLNGRTLQDSHTGNLIFGVPALVSFLSRTITLEPGDVIATGTPPGVGFARKPPVFLKEGDRMEVEIDGLGVLENPVVRRETDRRSMR